MPTCEGPTHRWEMAHMSGCGAVWGGSHHLLAYVFGLQISYERGVSNQRSASIETAAVRTWMRQVWNLGSIAAHVLAPHSFVITCARCHVLRCFFFFPLPRGQCTDAHATVQFFSRYRSSTKITKKTHRQNNVCTVQFKLQRERAVRPLCKKKKKYIYIYIFLEGKKEKIRKIFHKVQESWVWCFFSFIHVLFCSKYILQLTLKKEKKIALTFYVTQNRVL